MYLIFDTETSGLPNYKLPLNDPNQARIIQLAAILLDESFEEVACLSTLIKPDGWTIHPGAQAAHGIDITTCEKYGVHISIALHMFDCMYMKSTRVIAHNIKFDRRMIEVERALSHPDFEIKSNPEIDFCTMLSTTNLCRLPGRIPGQFKWPKLVELHKFLFGTEFEGAHDALADVRATAKCFKYLVENKLADMQNNVGTLLAK